MKTDLHKQRAADTATNASIDSRAAQQAAGEPDPLDHCNGCEGDCENCPLDDPDYCEKYLGKAAAKAPAAQDRRALELANAALIAAQPRDIGPEGWKRHEEAINATNCALHKPATPASTPEASQQAAAVAAPSEQMLADLDAVIGAVENNDTINARGIRDLYPVENARKAIECLRSAAATTSEDARDAARWRFSMKFQGDGSDKEQPQVIIELWRKVYAEHRLSPTREEYEAAIDAAMRATQQEGGK